MGLIFNTIAWLLFGILLPLLYVRSKIGKSLTMDAHSGSSTESATKRSYLLKKGESLATSPHPTIKTLFDILLYGTRVYPASKHLFGSRSLIKVHKESKDVQKTINGVQQTERKEWSFSELGSYRWLTYRDALQIVKDIGSGLVQLGLKKHDKVTIFASTQKEWMLMAYGCYSQGMVITTAYDNLGLEALIYSLNEGEVTTMFTQVDLFSVVKKLKGRVPTLKNILFTGEASKEQVDELKNATQFQVLSLDELQQLGHLNPASLNPPVAEDLCCIMYTSGSTGNPKGVMLTHANLVSSVAGGEGAFSLIFDGDETYLGYLPLAHVLEFLIENYCVYKGIKIGYGSPRTLTDQMVRNCKGDLRELRPTLMAGVPAVWETIKKSILAKLDELPPTKKALFFSAIELKKKILKMELPTALLKTGIPTFLLDKIVFRKVLEQVGGRLKAGISGGAPIAADTQEFLTCAMCPIVQG
jgi:long-chain acyl-CoA synthetase